MANNQSISDFIRYFGGGIRLNRFRVTGNVGGDGTGHSIIPMQGSGINPGPGTFHIRTASLPSSQMGAIPVNYRGRTVYYPGDRAYTPWDITVLDENPKETATGKTLYRLFHEWSDAINNHVGNTTTNTDPSLHFSDQRRSLPSTWTIELLDVNGESVLRRFKIFNCWPVTVGPLDMDMGQDNTLASFAVRILYSHIQWDTTGLPSN